METKQGKHTQKLYEQGGNYLDTRRETLAYKEIPNMENTILISTPTEKEIDEMEEKDMIAMNEKAFPYVPKMFPEMIGSKQAFEKYISKYCIVSLVTPANSCRMCQEVVARGRNKTASTGGKHKEGAIVTDKLNILGAGFTT